MEPFVHARKKAKPDAFAADNEKETISSALASKSKACTKFFSTSGCPYGEGCHFLHYIPGGVPTIGNAISAPLKKPGFYSSEAPPAPNFKTKLCTNYVTPEGCRFADKCHFAHGEKELGKPTTFPREIREERFPSHYGTRMSSTGLDSKLSHLGYGEPTPLGMAAAAKFGESATAKIPVDASLVGAIIGKRGSNTQYISQVTGVTLAINEDGSDPTKKVIELTGNFDQIKEASAMVKQLIMTSSRVTTSKQPGFITNNYKTKLCENYAQGTCTFGERCHFAHGASELRADLQKRS